MANAGPLGGGGPQWQTKACTIDSVVDDRFFHFSNWELPDFDHLFVVGHDFYGAPIPYPFDVEATLGGVSWTESTGWVWPNGWFIVLLEGQFLTVNDAILGGGVLQNLALGQEIHPFSGPGKIIAKCDSGLQPITGFLGENLAAENTADLQALVDKFTAQYGQPIHFDTKK
jgi:hypothetical protein